MQYLQTTKGWQAVVSAAFSTRRLGSNAVGVGQGVNAIRQQGSRAKTSLPSTASASTSAAGRQCYECGAPGRPARDCHFRTGGEGKDGKGKRPPKGDKKGKGIGKGKGKPRYGMGYPSKGKGGKSPSTNYMEHDESWPGQTVNRSEDPSWYQEDGAWRGDEQSWPSD